MMTTLLLAQEYLRDNERYKFKIRDERWLGIKGMIYDNVRDNNKDEAVRKADPDVIMFKIHNVKGNRARRRYDKSPHFSKQA